MFFLILVLIESLTLYISPVMGLSLVSIFVMASILSMIILSIGQNSETPGFQRNIPLCIIKVVCFITPIFLVHFWAGSLKPVTHDIEYKFATFNCGGEVSSNNLGQCYMKLENEADSDMLSIETSASDADIGGMNNYDPIVLHPLGIARPDFEKDHPYAVGIRDWISMSSNEIPKSSQKDIVHDTYDKLREKFKEETAQLAETLQTLTNIVEEGKMSKSLQVRMQGQIEAIRHQINDRLPFIGAILEENVHKSIEEAKSSFDAYMNRVQSIMGHEAARQTEGTLEHDIANGKNPLQLSKD